jgi:poly[(R)-3-hydroxyalkanoate] polymerase subunit PhaE
VQFFGSAYNMETPFTSAGFRPEAAFASAAERFFELLKIFGTPPAGQAPNWSSLAAPLAGQFEQWLRLSQAAGPWFAAGGGGWGAAPAGFSAPAAAAFGPLPLGPAAAQAGGAQRTWELWGRLAQLQTQLAAHWSEIANTAAQRFVARLGSAAGAPATPEQALKLYELWVDCAEQAYAATVHKEDFARLQAEMANTSAALLVEQRRHAETLVRAFGLPTRNEVDALYGQVKDLRRQLAELITTARPARKRGPPAARRRSGKRPRMRRPRA